MFSSCFAQPILFLHIRRSGNVKGYTECEQNEPKQKRLHNNSINTNSYQQNGKKVNVIRYVEIYIPNNFTSWAFLRSFSTCHSYLCFRFPVLHPLFVPVYLSICLPSFLIVSFCTSLHNKIICRRVRMKITCVLSSLTRSHVKIECIRSSSDNFS